MSETVVLADPKAVPAPSPASPPKLVCSRDEAMRHLQMQLEKGAQIKALRIRNGQELDGARAAKLEWTGRSTEILNGLFDTPQVAEQCNDWVGRIYPEYAEFGNFVEQFFAEMDHRIGRLKAVAKYVEKAPISGQTPAQAPKPAAPTPAAVVEPLRLQSLAGLLVAQKLDEIAKNTIAEFLKSLEVELHIVEQLSELAGAMDKNNEIGFAIVLSGEAQDDQFALGFCAGRVGMNRVILINTNADMVLTDEPTPLTHIALDDGGGWQLQLAKQLKRAGVSVDLNRLC